jgi:ACR3 family arsenite efflux pump ArsB
MRRVLRPVALALAVVFGGAVAFFAAFTVIGELGEALVIIAIAAFFTRRNRTWSGRPRRNLRAIARGAIRHLR